MNSHYRAKDDLFLDITEELREAHKAIVWIYNLLFNAWYLLN